MPVVRELLTRIGFQVDQRPVQQFERSLAGARSQMILAGNAIANTLRQVFSYVNEVAESASSTYDLARSAGIATEQLVAMRKAAEGFRVNPQQFESAFSVLSKGLREANAGFGNLFDLMRRSRGALDLSSFIDNRDVAGAFEAIIKYTRTLGNEQERLLVLDAAFQGQAPSLIRLVREEAQAFEEATQANLEYGKSFAQSEQEVIDYQKTVIELNATLNDFTRVFVLNFLKPLNDSVKSFSQIQKEINPNQEKSALSVFAEAAVDPLLSLFGYGYLDRLKAQESEDLARFRGDVDYYQRQNGLNLGMNPSITINVAPGTSEQQAQQMGEEMTGWLEDFWYQKTREVINNSPQVE